MIQIKDTTWRNIQDICNIHYDGVKSIVLERLANASTVPSSLRSYLNSPGVLEEIIKCKPNDMRNLESKIKAKAKSLHIKNVTPHLKRLFVYKKFSNKNTPDYNAYHLSANLDVKVCPYCNRQYTFTVIDINQDYTRPDFDHFLSNSSHPLFALSFYNLIPSCLLCNSRLKHNKKFQIDKNIHPYIEGFGTNAVFNYFPHNFESSVGLENQMDISLDVKEDAAVKDKIKENIKTFQLDKLYSGHADYVSEIIRKFYITNSDYLTMLHNTFPSITTKEELYRMAFGNYFSEQDYEKRVLAKLTKDIAKKLNLLEYLESM